MRVGRRPGYHHIMDSRLPCVSTCPDGFERGPLRQRPGSGGRTVSGVGAVLVAVGGLLAAVMVAIAVWVRAPLRRGHVRVVGSGLGPAHADLKLRYTRRQVPRATRPDAVDGDRCYLIKNVPLLRLTYQIRLLAAMAEDRSMRLIVVVPPSAHLSEDMRRFVAAARRSVSIQRAKS
jgi:hypothetical protein